MPKSEFAKQLDSLVMTDEQVIAQVQECMAAGKPINISTMRRGLEIWMKERQALPQLAICEKPLSTRQQRIYVAIVELTHTTGRQPTTREIGEAVGLSSSSTTHGHLERMAKKGYVRMDGRRGVSIIGRWGGGGR